MVFEENYLSWVRDAHAMEIQAETMLEKMVDRLEHYPDIISRLHQRKISTGVSLCRLRL
jgi:ferritin-like metal-binding protein YciE